MIQDMDEAFRINSFYFNIKIKAVIYDGTAFVHVNVVQIRYFVNLSIRADILLYLPNFAYCILF